MVKKNDMSKAFDKYGPALKKFSEEVGVVAKKGEEGVIKMSKMLKIQLDMLGVSLQKEKLYYELGKKVASSRSKKEGSESVAKPLLQKLRKIETDVRSKKREISGIKKVESSRKKEVSKVSEESEK